MDILVVDDERIIREGVADVLQAAGYDVRLAKDGCKAVDAVRQYCPDLVLLDVMMPGMDGFEACRLMREVNPDLPILFLSAYDATDNRVRGLKLGADDFLSKTMSSEEMLLRIAAVLHRAGSVARTSSFRFGDAIVDPGGMNVVTPEGVRYELSQREIALLRTCVTHKGEALSDDYLISVLWGRDAEMTSSALKQVIHRLRDKLGAARLNLKSVRSFGFMYSP